MKKKTILPRLIYWRFFWLVVDFRDTDYIYMQYMLNMTHRLKLHDDSWTILYLKFFHFYNNLNWCLACSICRFGLSLSLFLYHFKCKRVGLNQSHLCGTNSETKFVTQRIYMNSIHKLSYIDLKLFMQIKARSLMHVMLCKRYFGMPSLLSTLRHIRITFGIMIHVRTVF